jgi:beta-glucosidase
MGPSVRALACIALTAFAVVAGATTAAAAGRCGDHPWCDTTLSADERAGLLLGALTRDEKISLLAGDDLGGVSGGENGHIGTSDGVERVGLPTTYFTDGPVGVRQGKATGMPSSMTVAATFDPNLAFNHAAVIGDEARRKGNDVIYAPAVNMMRTPLNGRTFEYFGEDPFLAGEMAVGWTEGVQSEGVIANVKHYSVNNQEGAGGQVPGTPLGAAAIGSRMTVDAQLDERTLREIYMPQFEAAIREGGAGSVMCAYLRVNGTYACENEHLLEDILKEEWGFPGFVLTDYGAAKNTGPSLRNGLDLDIWPGFVYQPSAVNAAVASGQASDADVDEHVRRILRTLFAFGFFDREAYVQDTSSIDQAAHDEAAAAIEAQGSVLLENDGGLLPLDPDGVGRVAVIGPEADVIKDGGGSSKIDFFRATTPLAGIEQRVGAENVVYDDGSDAARAADVASGADVAVVVVGDRMTEGSDKACMGLNCSQSDTIDRDALVEAVAAAQPRTVVVLQSGGPVLTPWRDSVPALLEAWYPGQNGGTAIARVLFGDAEPAGRLPATFPLREADEPVAGDPEQYPGVAETVQYKEGVFIGYRWFDEQGLGVAYPFGYGLGYTTFRIGGLRLERGGGDPVVSVRVKNTGDRAGSAAPQLYVGMPDPGPGIEQPPLQLKGFDRIELEPGERRRVRFALDERSFSYWDEDSDGWRVEPGCYRIVVGEHSRDAAVEGVVARGADCAGALVASGRRRGRLKLSVRPKRVTTGCHRFTFRVTTRRGGKRRPVRRAVVRFAGERARTRRGGRARMRACLGDARRYRARARKRGFRKGRVRVRAARASAGAAGVAPRLAG